MKLFGKTIHRQKYIIRSLDFDKSKKKDSLEM